MHERGRRLPPAALTVPVICLLSLCVLAFQRNTVWTDDRTLWSDILAKSPGKARAQYNLGVVILEQGDAALARSHFLAALSLNPRYVDAYTNLGKAELQLGNRENAKDAFRAAIRLAPKTVLAHFNLGVVYLEDGLNDAARREFEAVLSARPDFMQARQFLSYIDRGR